MKPWYSPVSTVVYSATGSDVDSGVVDGNSLLRGGGEVLEMDEARIWTEADR